MKHSAIGRVAMVFGLAVLIGLAGVSCDGAGSDSQEVAQMVDLADQFLMSLSDEERGRATFGFASDERERFHFVPPEVFERHGFPLRDMSAEQRERAHDLLKTGLSQSGYMTATEIIEVEAILQALEGDGGQFSRDPELYFVSVFGTPSTDGTWAWRFEGHHLSLHFTIVDGAITVSTPTFLAASPAEVMEGPRAGLRPLGSLEDAGRALLASLDPSQRAVAIIEEVAPTNIVRGVELAPDPLSPVGIVGSDLTAAQQAILMEVIEFYTSKMADDIAALRRAKVEDDGIENITFAWAGGTSYGDVSYFRVQGPSFLIEFDHTQSDPNHIHSGWRDFDGDFGRDVLRDHLAQVVH